MYFTNICSILCDFMQLNLFIALMGSAFGLPPKDSDIQKIFGILKKKEETHLFLACSKNLLSKVLQLNRCFHL